MIKQKNRQGRRKKRDKLAEIVRHEDRDMKKQLSEMHAEYQYHHPCTVEDYENCVKLNNVRFCPDCMYLDKRDMKPEYT